MCEIAHQKCLLGYLLFGFFQRSTPEAAELIFTHHTSNDVVPRKDVPFRG